MASEDDQDAPRDEVSDSPGDEAAVTRDAGTPDGAAPVCIAADSDTVVADEHGEPAPPTIAPSALRAATQAPDGDNAATHQGPGDVLRDEIDGEEPDGLGEPPDASNPVVAEDVAGAAVDAVTNEGAADEEIAEDDEATRLWREVPLATRLEALLFASPEPLSLRRLQTMSGGEDASDVRDALASLEAHYQAAARAFTVMEIGGGYQLRTRAELSDLLAGMGRRPSNERLSPAAIETLAIVAYRQPVLRVDVEKIRGVASGEVLRGLIEKGLARVAGRADLPGSPLLYGTTPAFLELFGLRDLKDLPNDREMLRRPL